MRKKAKMEKGSSFLGFFKKLFLFFLSLLMIIFLAINIFFSQNINPLFLRVVKPNYQAVVVYLKKIKKTPYFSTELDKFKKIYGQKIIGEVFSEDIKREKRIKKLESFLNKNSDSRDILYQLYLLYKEVGNEKTAKKYLQKAKEIDPWIK